MSKKRNRCKLNKAKTSKEYLVIQNNLRYPDYWDDGVMFYPRYKRGTKQATKQILKYQIRMYKTWKYNRKTKWK